ncbi:cinnamyl-alcohol dehydrogenase [Trifolium repens]|nr:cinnamyl-alcohol dehydrogenase [Trifolium repens]
MASEGKIVEHTKKAFGWAARDPTGVLSPFNFFRRETGEKDVAFKVLYCGICHSDLHMSKNEWFNTFYPFVPGHELVGVVTEVGSKVEKFKVGDKVGVGYVIDSCRSCQNCDDNLENYCPKYTVTCGAKYRDGTITYGGYSDSMVAEEHFVICIPDNLPLDVAGPLLCAGVTVYSPLKYFGLDKPGLHIGVVGLGGLGHMAVKFAKAFGARVTVISTSPNKEAEALDHLGADAFIISRDPNQMQAAIGTMDGIIDTVSAGHPLLPIIGRKLIAGSTVGGIKETQEMIDFAAKHGVKPDIEIVPIDYVNTALERLAKADVKYRFVIDIGNTLKESS